MQYCYIIIKYLPAILTGLRFVTTKHNPGIFSIGTKGYKPDAIFLTSVPISIFS